jgi:hypothetical protein
MVECTSCFPFWIEFIVLPSTPIGGADAIWSKNYWQLYSQSSVNKNKNTSWQPFYFERFDFLCVISVAY